MPHEQRRHGGACGAAAAVVTQAPLGARRSPRKSPQSVSGYSDLHLRGLMDAGHPVCICTDDSGVFGTTLSLELALAARYVGLDLRQLARMQEHAATMAMDKDPRVAQRIKEMVADWRMAFQI